MLDGLLVYLKCRDKRKCFSDHLRRMLSSGFRAFGSALRHSREITLLCAPKVAHRLTEVGRAFATGKGVLAAGKSRPNLARRDTGNVESGFLGSQQ
jgi:hypothetical protein